MGHQYIGRYRSQSDRGEIFVRLVGDFRVKAGIDYEATAHGENGVAIRDRPGCGAHTEISADASLVLDIELLPEPLRKLLHYQSRENVSRSAWSEWHDHAHRPRWIGLRPSKWCHGGKPDTKRGQMQESSTRNFHCGLSVVRKGGLSTRKSLDRFGRAA